MDIPTKSNNLSFHPITIGIDIYPLRKKGVFDREFNKGNMGIQGEKLAGEACGRSTLSTSLLLTSILIYSYNTFFQFLE